MYQVLKRDGKVVDFDIAKISEAIKMAFEAQEKQYHPTVIDLLALKVTAEFEPKIKEGLIAVEDIQDSVESVLIQAGYADIAKAYILYRRQREKLRNLKSTILDYKELVNSYVNVTDWRVKENSTVTYSVGGLILSNSGAITANYWLSEIYDDEIANSLYYKEGMALEEFIFIVDFKDSGITTDILNNKLLRYEENYKLLNEFYKNNAYDGRGAYLLAVMAQTLSKPYDEQLNYYKNWMTGGISRPAMTEKPQHT